MQKFLLSIFALVAFATGTAMAQSNIDVITLSKFTDYTPGANKWFNNLSFGSYATYSGHVKIANDESGLVFEKKSDAFYVTKPVDDARVKSIALTFLSTGELEVYMSNTRQLSMSGGSDVAKFTISASSPVLDLTDDYKYFIFRNAGNEFIVSMITVVWQVNGEVEELAVPTLCVDGVEYDAATPLDLNGQPKRISFTHPEAEATVYYMWEPDNEPGFPFYTPYTEEFELTKTGTLSYYCELSGRESNVVEMKVVGQEVEIDAISEIEATTSGESEWFNLRGQAVKEPSRGIFIRRTGSKIEKIVR